jgi:hypothetical protein
VRHGGSGGFCTVPSFLPMAIPRCENPGSGLREI